MAASGDIWGTPPKVQRFVTTLPVREAVMSIKAERSCRAYDRFIPSRTASSIEYGLDTLDMQSEYVCQVCSEHTCEALPVTAAVS